MDLGNKRYQDLLSEMLETIRSMKTYLKIFKDDNYKLLKEKVEQEEINEILLKSLTEKKQHRHVGQTSSNDKQGSLKEECNKRKEHEMLDEDGESVESLDKKRMIITLDNNTSKELVPKNKKSKGFGIELHGNSRKLDPLLLMVS